jgi:hypothetical protein
MKKVVLRAGETIIFCHPKMELVMETFCLHWKLRAHFQRFSLVPPWDLSFWAKAIGFHFFQAFWYVQA